MKLPLLLRIVVGTALLIPLLLIVLHGLRHGDERVPNSFDDCVAPPVSDVQDGTPELAVQPGECRSIEGRADISSMHLWCAGVDGPGQSAGSRNKAAFRLPLEGRPKANAFTSFEDFGDLAEKWENPREFRRVPGERMLWRIFRFRSQLQFCEAGTYYEVRRPIPVKKPFMFVHTRMVPDFERERLALLIALACVSAIIAGVGLVLNRLLAAEIVFDRHSHKNSRLLLSNGISAAFLLSKTLAEAQVQIGEVLDINRATFSDEGGDPIEIIEPWDLFRDLKELYNRPELTVETECPDWLKFEGWPKSFLRALHNAIQNASNVEDCDRIRLLARQERESWVAFVIENNGQAVPEGIVKRFNRRRAYPAPRRAGRQRSGLRIILRTARKHGGTATLENLAPSDPHGMSVRLTLRLPAEQPRGTPRARWMRRMLQAVRRAS